MPSAEELESREEYYKEHNPIVYNAIKDQLKTDEEFRRKMLYTDEELKKFEKKKAQKVKEENHEEIVDNKEEKPIITMIKNSYGHKTEKKKLKDFQKEKQRLEKEKKEAEVEVIQLIARKNFLKNKLNCLNPGKIKQAKMIANINVEIRNIEYKINELRDEYGIDIDDIYQGSKIKRVGARIKNTFHKVWKRTKKFFKRNCETILYAGAIIVPIIVALITKKPVPTNTPPVPNPA